MVFSGYMLRSGIARSFDNSVFNFSRNLETAFCSGCTNLHYHQQCNRVPFFPTPSQVFINYRFYDDGHSDWCKGHRFTWVLSIYYTHTRTYTHTHRVSQSNFPFFDHPFNFFVSVHLLYKPYNLNVLFFLSLHLSKFSKSSSNSTTFWCHL